MNNISKSIINKYKTYGLDFCKQDIQSLINAKDFASLNDLLSENEILFEIINNKNIIIDTKIIFSKQLKRFDIFSKSFTHGKWSNNLLTYIENHMPQFSSKEIDFIIRFYKVNLIEQISTIYFQVKTLNYMTTSNLYNFINAFYDVGNVTMLNICASDYPKCKNLVDGLINKIATSSQTTKRV